MEHSEKENYVVAVLFAAGLHLANLCLVFPTHHVVHVVLLPPDSHFSRLQACEQRVWNVAAVLVMEFFLTSPD